MIFHAFGLNHQTAPVSVREAFALSEAGTASFYAALDGQTDAEVLVLSTCNRTEVYLFGGPEDVEVVRAALVAQAGMAWPAGHTFHLQDEAAILHLVRVTAGVASQVIGDAQILAQMKQAYRMAVEADRVDTVLHRLLHTAFRTAKRVRSETSLSDGTASVSSAAVQAARTHFEQTTGEGLAGRHVLLVGLGHMGVAALRSLRSLGVRRISLTNRSLDRAEQLATEFDAAVVGWDDRHAAAGTADVIIVASAAAEPVLHADALPERFSDPALVVDVAVPRNVDPAVAGTPGYELVDIDALNGWRQAAASHRQAALPAAERICEESVAEYVTWVLHHEALQPALHALRDTFDAIRIQAIEQYGDRFQDADREELDRMTRSILQKLLAVPIVRLKSTDPGSLDFARGVRFLTRVFSRPGCEDESARDPASLEGAAEVSLPVDDRLASATADATRDAG